MNARRAIARIHAIDNAWVRVERVHRIRAGLRLDLTVCQGKGGVVRAEWVLTCRGVREVHIEDLDGGGIQLWGVSHPAARQYSDTVATIACSPDDVPLAIGVLFQAHVAAVDDWIPFERYLGLDVPAPAAIRTLRLSGPTFLLNRYALALRGIGVRCETKRRVRAAKGRPFGMIHFGNSFVVAVAFDLQPGRQPLATPKAG